MVKLLILPGSARRASYNRKLAAVAARLATAEGAEVDLIDPADFRLPLFDQELEDAEGLPAAAKALKAKFLASDAVLFASPEYNSSITPLLKNAIDWISRTESDDEPALAAFRGKVAGLLAASPGQLGGLRGLVHLRAILGNLGVHVVPGQFALAGASDKFDDTTGALKSSGDEEAVRKVVRQTLALAGKLQG